MDDNKHYSQKTNVWHFGYIAYLLTSLKFNFQRIKPHEMKKLSPFFYKVLEKSKIRTIYSGPVFDIIWDMMQPNPDVRCSWSNV